MIRSFLLLVACLSPLHGQIDLQLPTGNQYIFSNTPKRFYMHTNRFFEGKSSKPWTGGCYGYVRNMRRVGDNLVIGTRLHEGIDISPLKRDSTNNPLDKIGAIAAGKVVHINANSSKSNYGRYLVVEHNWENSKVYSLYSHLSTISCKVGQQVKAGDTLGVMGYTGRGLDRARSHLHLELNLLVTTRYEKWAEIHQMINHHGIYNGINMTGCDIGELYHQQRTNPQLKFSDFVASQPVHFKVMAPGKCTPDFVKRYPWICHGDPEGARSWEISFSSTGFPVAFAPKKEKVKTAYISSIRPSEDIPHQYMTRYLISGIGNRATLGTNGQKLVKMLMGDF